MKDGFIKVACASPDVHVADCDYNATQIIDKIKEAHSNGAKLIAFPELSITGYTWRFISTRHSFKRCKKISNRYSKIY